MFAYPCGGERGASSLTFLLFVVGAGVLWCRGRKAIVLTCLAPFGMALAAAALEALPLRRPGAAWVAGAGHAIPRAWHLPAGGRGRRGPDRPPSRSSRSDPGLCLAQSSSSPPIGIIPVAADCLSPLSSIFTPSAPRSSRGNSGPRSSAMPTRFACAGTCGIGEWDSTNLNVAVYLCNQMIYSPAPAASARSAAEPVLGQPAAPLRVAADGSG